MCACAGLSIDIIFPLELGAEVVIIAAVVLVNGLQHKFVCTFMFLQIVIIKYTSIPRVYKLLLVVELIVGINKENYGFPNKLIFKYLKTRHCKY